MSWRCPYDRCEGTGFIYDEEKNIATDCPCRPQMIAQGRASRLRARIPRRYANVDFNQPPVTDMPAPIVRVVKRYVDQLDQRLQEGRGLWFEGPQGTGKTTLAMLVSKHALAAGRSTAIYSVPRILAELRDTFDDDAEWGSTELIDRLTEVELLQLDDLGAERTSPWVLEQLYAVINARYEAERAVLVTTNLGREALIEQVGARTVSRLTEMCDVIPLYGEDRRLTASMGSLGMPQPSDFGTPPASPDSGSAYRVQETYTLRNGEKEQHRKRIYRDPREELQSAVDQVAPSDDTPEWHSPAPAANLEPPAWSRRAAPSNEPAPTAEPPSWWDRRDPWPPTAADDAETGLQGSSRRGTPDA
jgi:DNA replication protein DnaC